MNNPAQVLSELLGGHPGCKFVSFTYRNQQGELSRYTIAVGVNLERAYRRDVSVLQKRLGRAKDQLIKDATQELLESLRESVRVGIGNNSNYTQIGVYTNIASGIRVHKETGQVYVYGFRLTKKVLEPGTYKERKSSDLVKAKNEIRRHMKVGRFRNFVLNADQLQTARLNGKTLELVNQE